jgi:hypothetical protein
VLAVTGPLPAIGTQYDLALTTHLPTAKSIAQTAAANIIHRNATVGRSINIGGPPARFDL